MFINSKFTSFKRGYLDNKNWSLFTIFQVGINNNKGAARGSQIGAFNIEVTSNYSSFPFRRASYSASSSLFKKTLALQVDNHDSSSCGRRGGGQGGGGLYYF